ncbi:histidine kinase [Chryseolinea lacunae]|uniref:Histidine kinase n=1 Tax=Chryseolinea lacunae TaxID=2801331 RepID=A0ABS1KPH3_9BACT|nr:histidine kinase [Chryseolinea lacunae]MBL0740602.1 histidine kinase [Chryseolinea lacunae]
MINFFSVDKDGVLTYVNINDPGLRDRLVAGKNYWAEHPEEVGGAFYEACLRVLKDQKPATLEVYHIADETWWENQIYPVRDGLAVYCWNKSSLRFTEGHRIIDLEHDIETARKKINNLKLAAWRAAIDAHFIFGTLNSIQHYIIENDQESAINYLASFAKLIRGVRDSTVSDTTRLGEELELVKNYVSLEQMRDEAKFDFKLTHAADVDLTMKIPPMIIKPFLENAIVHRLRRGAEKKGTLALSVETGHQQVVIKIKDNGIDREPPADHRRREMSVSAMITEERLRLMHSEESISISITDNVENGEALGKTVILSIPFARQ